MEVEWTEKEDEIILQAWVDGKNEDNIAHSPQFEGKCQCDIRQRFKHLYGEKGPSYRQLMGMEESRPLPHALDKALGKIYLDVEVDLCVAVSQCCSISMFKLGVAAREWRGKNEAGP